MLKFLRHTGRKTRDGHLLGEYECSCGNVGEYLNSRVKNGYVSNCHQCARDIIKEKNKKHGMRHEAEYRIWCGIKNRCNNKASKSYKKYGGKGIAMFDDWANDFVAFIEHVGRRPSPLHSIDRIDNTKGYEPENVRWATIEQQARNKGNSIYVTDGSRTMHISEAAQIVGITRGAAHMRLRRGKLHGYTRVY